MRITKFSCESCESRNNHRYAVVVQDIWSPQWIQSYPCKTKTSQENTKGACNEVLGARRGNQKSFTLTIPWNFGKSCEELSWESLYVNATHIRNKVVIAERAVRRVKEGTSAVLLQSGLDNESVGGFHGMLLLSAKYSRSFI